jgi:hypothetical protein
MPLLKSVASVTTGDPDTDFRVIACSSVIAWSLWRTTSKVIGSTDPAGAGAPAAGASIVLIVSSSLG